MSLALRYEPRLKGCFAWNDFRHRVEVVRKTPWCLPEWWETTYLTPVGHRALRDADMAKLGNYLTGTYDFGACAMQASRAAIHAEAEDHIFDELKDWIDALPDWDGVARLNDWLTTYAGADPQGAHSGVSGPGWLEIHHAGAQPRAQPRRQGRLLADLHRPPGGRQRPRARGDVRALLPRGHSVAASQPRPTSPSASPGRSSRTAPRCRPGAKSDVEEQKAALTRCVDHGRPAYGYETRSYPRRTCLAFSLNDTDSCRTRPATAATGPST